ncbi:hypothetical protein SAMN02745157_0728 [Kaistia soli DSM 19436]|uniref:Sialate O-acetylesterase domain-containing protein n=1 Tax=Kaistia soli DSM 19436 TaxID=1122133 RepID=A0A1M4VKK9_9HYPH|nr:sialate O-acetylesterase [Kaistia soli]SHE69362.1 hypothetical protein SAMN02745157_0728 [Kaistia soli DSM 19436]
MLKTLYFGFVALLFAFFVGGMSARHDMFPWPQLFAAKQRALGAKSVEASRYVFEDNGLLVADESKTAVACPSQTDRTAVLLVLGQSNASNHAGQRYRSGDGDRVVNFFGGKCYVAASPLLGSTGSAGEYWTLLGNLLVASGKFDSVVLAPLAVTGSVVQRWAKGGDLNTLLIDTAGQVRRAGYQVTDVLWVQGEADYVKGTGSDAYRDRFLSMVDTLRQQGVDAPVYISTATKCLEPSNGGFKVHDPDNAIVRAQEALHKAGNGIRAGIDTDILLDEVDRYDDCHFGGSGNEKAAQAWTELLLNDQRQLSMQ